MESVKKQALITGGILAFDVVALLVFGVLLRWI